VTTAHGAAAVRDCNLALRDERRLCFTRRPARLPLVLGGVPVSAHIAHPRGVGVRPTGWRGRHVDPIRIGPVDYTLIALIGLIVLTVVGSTRSHSRTWSGRPGYQYQRVITAGVFGLWLTVAGAIGWDLSHVHGSFLGTKWVDGPIW